MGKESSPQIVDVIQGCNNVCMWFDAGFGRLLRAGPKLQGIFIFQQRLHSPGQQVRHVRAFHSKAHLAHHFNTSFALPKP